MAALLEVYVKRVPDSLHLPAMVPPLLQALDRAGKPSGSPTLAQRLQVHPGGEAISCAVLHITALPLSLFEGCVGLRAGWTRVCVCTGVCCTTWAVMTLIRASDGARLP